MGIAIISLKVVPTFRTMMKCQVSSLLELKVLAVRGCCLISGAVREEQSTIFERLLVLMTLYPSFHDQKGLN